MLHAHGIETLQFKINQLGPRCSKIRPLMLVTGRFAMGGPPIIKISLSILKIPV
jgi:hypothetical protein